MDNKTGLRHELVEFIRFFTGYFHLKAVNSWIKFEKTKNIVVAFLVVKRGKYSQSFLNTSFLILISAALIGGPVIAENNPIIADYLAQYATGSQSVLITDVSDISLQTNITKNVRDKVVDYQVKSGDTIGTIADKFGVSIDSIKWLNKTKSNIIKENQIIKIPPITGIVHTVARGETVYSIAKRYQVDAQNIANYPFNDFADLDSFTLLPGQTLIVPEGVMPAEKPVPSRRSIYGPIVAGTPGTGSFIWPTSGTISQSPVFYHMALDIANRSLPPVLASDTGTVVYAGCVAYGYGCHIMIDHGNGYQTLYGHLSKILVSTEPGQNNVGKGQQIGVVGSTGRSTGPHLHFEIRQGGTLLNPVNFLK